MAVKELPFSFDAKSIENPSFKERIRGELNELVGPYLNDISDLFISLHQSFFHVETVPLIHPDENQKELAEWECFKQINDEPENYYYGYFQDKGADKTYLAILRKEIYNFILDLVHSLDGDIKMNFIGINYRTEKNLDIFFIVNNKIKDIYDKDKSRIKTVKSSGLKWIFRSVSVAVIIFIILMGVKYIYTKYSDSYFTGNQNTVTEKADTTKVVTEEKVAEVSKQENAKTVVKKEEPKPVVKYLNIADFNKEHFGKDIKVVTYSENLFIAETSNTKVAEKIMKDYSDYNIDIAIKGKDKNIIVIKLKNTNLNYVSKADYESALSKVRVKDRTYYSTLNSVSDLNNFMKNVIKSDTTVFKKFRADLRNRKVNISADFE